MDLIHRSYGVESYSGYLRYSRRYDDLYMGLGGSYRINDKFSLGASTFLSVKLMDYDYRQLASAFQDSDSVTIDGVNEPMYVAESNFEESLKYWDLSLVFKLGAHYALLENRLGFGVNLTLPNIPIYGSADVRKSFLISNVYDNSQDQFTANRTFIEVENDMKTRIKSPFSAAFGVHYTTANGKNDISFTLEYFHQIDQYELFDSDYHATNLPEGWEDDMEAIKPMSYSYQARSLTNFALGFRQYISPSFFFLGGFRTDFTNGQGSNIRTSENAFKVNQIHTNKYHITLGPFIKLRRVQFITGV